MTAKNDGFLQHSTGDWKDHIYESKTGSKNSWNYKYPSYYWKQHYEKKKGDKTYDPAKKIDELLKSDDGTGDGDIYQKIGEYLKQIYASGDQEDIKAAEWMIAEGMKGYDQKTKDELYWFVRYGQGEVDDDSDSDEEGSSKSKKKSKKSKSDDSYNFEDNFGDYRDSKDEDKSITYDAAQAIDELLDQVVLSSPKEAKQYIPKIKENYQDIDKHGSSKDKAAIKRMISTVYDKLDENDKEDLMDTLEHSGIKGQKWGIRRYQNEDRTWTEEGKIRYSKSKGKHRLFKKKREPTHEELLKSTNARELYKYRDRLTTQELNERYNRLNAERNMKNIREDPKFVKGAKAVAKVLGTSAATLGSIATIISLYDKWERNGGKMKGADVFAGSAKEFSKIFKHSAEDGMDYLYGVPIETVRTGQMRSLDDTEDDS